MKETVTAAKRGRYEVALDYLTAITIALALLGLVVYEFKLY